MRTVIADHEPAARAAIRRILDGTSGIEVIAECADRAAVMAAVRRLAPDLIVLQVPMPGAGACDALTRLIPELVPAVVFVTEIPALAVQAFDVGAIDCIRRPVDPERLRLAVTRAYGRYRDGIGPPPFSSSQTMPAIHQRPL